LPNVSRKNSTNLLTPTWRQKRNSPPNCTNKNNKKEMRAAAGSPFDSIFMVFDSIFIGPEKKKYYHMPRDFENTTQKLEKN
jgi:hypothetical protein